MDFTNKFCIFRFPVFMKDYPKRTTNKLPGLNQLCSFFPYPTPKYRKFLENPSKIKGLVHPGSPKIRLKIGKE